MTIDRHTREDTCHMVSMVRPGEGGIYDKAKVFMMRRYRNRVTGVVGNVEDGHWICGMGKKEELGFGHIWLEVPSAHPVDNDVDAGLNFGVQGGVRWRGSKDSGIACKQSGDYYINKEILGIT